MSFIVFCTFDLKGASSQDYRNAYSDLRDIGLEKIQKADNGNEVVIPTTSVMGEFSGTNSAQIRDDIRKKIRKKFQSRGFDSEIFLVVGDDWSWGAGTT